MTKAGSLSRPYLNSERMIMEATAMETETGDRGEVASREMWSL